MYIIMHNWYFICKKKKKYRKSCLANTPINLRLIILNRMFQSIIILMCHLQDI